MKQAISVADLKKLLTTNKPALKVIDVRSPDEYVKQHLAFAENFPSSGLESFASMLNPADIIVCVCNKGHERSQDAADKLGEIGYPNVFYLEGGMLGWLEHAE